MKHILFPIACFLSLFVENVIGQRFVPLNSGEQIGVFQRELFPGGPRVPINSNVPVLPVFQHRQHPGGPFVPGPPSMPEGRIWINGDGNRSRIIIVNEQQAREETNIVGERSRAQFIEQPQNIIQNPEFYTPESTVDVQKVKKYIETLRPVGSWTDISYSVPKEDTESHWHALTHLARLYFMTRELHLEGGELYKNVTLRNKCLVALRFWLNKDFNHPNIVLGVLEAEEDLIPTILMLQNDMTESDTKKAIERLEHSFNKAVDAAVEPFSGKSLLWLVSNTKARGVLAHDPILVAQASEWLASGIAFDKQTPEGKKDTGLQKDYSFRGGNGLFSSQGEGQSFLSESAAHAASFSGTTFALKDDKIEILTDMLLKGNRWMAFGDAADPSAEGSQIANKGEDASYLQTVAKNLALANPQKKDELSKFSENLIGNKMFWTTDYMTHRRPKFFSSVRMISDRVPEQPVTTGSALQGFFMSGGANPIVQNGNEYKDIYPLWSWAKVPGTTVPQVPISLFLKTQDELPQIAVAHSFVGGVSDGLYGFTAFDFERGKCRAKKATFFFDDEIVSLGADINGETEFPVLTTVNQCRLFGGVFASQKSESSNSLYEMKQGLHELQNANWVWQNGIGYVFPTPANVYVQNDKATGNWWAVNDGLSRDEITDELFTLCIDHGTAPKNGRYAYIAVIDKPAIELPEYINKLPIQIVKNGPEMQAIWHDTLKIGCAAFYTAGKIAFTDSHTLEANRPCLVIARIVDDKLQISVSDPTQSGEPITLKISGNWRGKGVQPAEGRNTTTLLVDMPSCDEAGSSVSVMLE